MRALLLDLAQSYCSRRLCYAWSTGGSFPALSPSCRLRFSCTTGTRTSFWFLYLYISGKEFCRFSLESNLYGVVILFLHQLLTVVAFHHVKETKQINVNMGNWQPVLLSWMPVFKLSLDAVLSFESFPTVLQFKINCRDLLLFRVQAVIFKAFPRFESRYFVPLISAVQIFHFTRYVNSSMRVSICQGGSWDFLNSYRTPAVNYRLCSPTKPVIGCSSFCMLVQTSFALLAAADFQLIKYLQLFNIPKNVCLSKLSSLFCNCFRSCL